MDQSQEPGMSSVQDLQRIVDASREIGAIGEVLSLLEGIGGPTRIEPDALGVIGRMIAARVAEILEAAAGVEPE